MKEQKCKESRLPGFPGTLVLRQRCPGVPPKVIPMLRSTNYFNSPVQISEKGFLEPLEVLGTAPPKICDRKTILFSIAFLVIFQPPSTHLSKIGLKCIDHLISEYGRG